MDPHTTLTIRRLDDECLTLDGFRLAHAFFVGDASSVGDGAYDSLTGRGHPCRITVDDIRAINTTMRARSRHERWAHLLDRDLAWLAALDPRLDLIAADDREWSDAAGEQLVTAAFRETVGPWRGPSVVTKVLHLKRPSLFPVLDDFVAVMLGVNMPDDAPPERKVQIAVTLMLHLRRQGRRNLSQLEAVQQRLAEQEINRSLVRILDAIVWSSHPAIGVPGMKRTLTVAVD